MPSVIIGEEFIESFISYDQACSGEGRKPFVVPAIVGNCVCTFIIAATIGMPNVNTTQIIAVKNFSPTILSATYSTTKGTNYLSKKIELNTPASQYIKSSFLIEAYNGILTSEVRGGVDVMNKNSSIFGKITGVTMGWITLTPVKVFAKEMTELHTENTGVKAVASVLLATVTAWAGFPIVDVIAGLVIIAVLDVLFSLVPGAIKEGTEADHKLQAKLWAFIINFGGIVFASVACNVYINLGGSGWAKIIAGSINYLVAFWLISIYVVRVIAYIARVNKVSVPWFSKLLAKGKGSSRDT